MKKIITLLFAVSMNHTIAQLNPATMIQYRDCQKLAQKEDKIQCLKRSLLAHQLILRTYNGIDKKQLEEKIKLIEKKLNMLETVKTDSK